jgi:hypothetical protein
MAARLLPIEHDPFGDSLHQGVELHPVEHHPWDDPLAGWEANENWQPPQPRLAPEQSGPPAGQEVAASLPEQPEQQPQAQEAAPPASYEPPHFLRIEHLSKLARGEMPDGLPERPGPDATESAKRRWRRKVSELRRQAGALAE